MAAQGAPAQPAAQAAALRGAAAMSVVPGLPSMAAVGDGSAPRRRTTAPSPWAAAELAELFQPAAPEPEEIDLPEVGISQNDVDRLFGSVP